MEENLAWAMLFELIFLDLRSSSGYVQAEDGMVLSGERTPGTACTRGELALFCTPGCSAAEIQAHETV